MPPLLADIVVGAVQTYLLAGVAFALAFAARGVSRIDPMAEGAALAFRLLIVPGAALCWPLLLFRWAAGSMAPPVESNAHRRAARRPR
ncbi:MAG: hypothetical protein AB1635_08570 [Acidobacteriota bacterium]